MELLLWLVMDIQLCHGGLGNMLQYKFKEGKLNLINIEIICIGEVGDPCSNIKCFQLASFPFI